MSPVQRGSGAQFETQSWNTSATSVAAGDCAETCWHQKNTAKSSEQQTKFETGLLIVHSVAVVSLGDFQITAESLRHAREIFRSNFIPMG